MLICVNIPQDKPVMLFIWFWFEVIMTVLVVVKDIILVACFQGKANYPVLACFGVNLYMLKVVHSYHFEVSTFHSLVWGEVMK